MSRSGGGAHARLLRAGLRLQREEMGIGVREAARRVSEELKKDPTATKKSVSSSTLSAWENDVSQPSQDQIAAWCRALDMVYDPQIYSVHDERIPVLLQPRTLRLARTADMLTDRQVEVLAAVAEALLESSS